MYNIRYICRVENVPRVVPLVFLVKTVYSNNKLLILAFSLAWAPAVERGFLLALRYARTLSAHIGTRVIAFSWSKEHRVVCLCDIQLST